jgi:mRNA interferase RelE/StbE
MYRVNLSAQATRFYASAALPLAKKIARCPTHLENDPRRHNNIKSLQGEFSEAWRYRIGDHRVIYEIDERAKVIQVTTIVHRREAYR